MTKRRKLAAKKLLLPLIALCMMTTAMALGSVGHARPVASASR